MSTATEQRQAVADLTNLASRDLSILWAQLSLMAADQIRDALIDLLPGLGAKYGDAAVALGAGFFEAARERSGARGSFDAVLATPPDSARWEALARWGVDPLYAEQPDAATTLTRVQGGLQRSIADQHRMTVVQSAIADPEASGWRRVGVGETCGFCRMLLSRGAVYTEASVEFKSHDHCNCVASPTWAPNVRKVIGIPFDASKRNRSDATLARDNDRVRSYIKENFPDAR